MVSTRKKRQSNRRLLSQLDDFDQYIVIGNTPSERQKNTIVNEGTADRDFIVGTSGNNLVTNENTVNLKTWERCFNERIDREMSNFVDTAKDKNQNPILTTTDSIVAPKMELAIRSIKASPGQESTSVTAYSERGEHIGVTAPF